MIDADTGMSCANFHLYERKVVTALFSADGLSGEISFSQDNPYSSTIMTVSLKVRYNKTFHHLS